MMRSVTPRPLAALCCSAANCGFATQQYRVDFRPKIAVFLGLRMIAQSLITDKNQNENLNLTDKKSKKTNINTGNIKHKNSNDCATKIKMVKLCQINKGQVNTQSKPVSEFAPKKTDVVPHRFRTMNSMDATPVACVLSPSGNNYA